jgi:ABC-type transport system involved in cytochrome c biogenesis permease subunit
MDRITVFCFAASYAVALLLELAQLAWPRPIQRLIGLGFGAAGLLAHTLYLAVQQPSLATPVGSLLFLAWIVAVFYLYGSIHHGRIAWGLFVLPLILGMIALSGLVPEEPTGREGGFLASLLALRGERFWGTVHGTLVLLAAVGVCVGFVASLMYLVQMQRLRSKLPPSQGMKLLSLERIEEMNRRAILWAFPLLTAGLLAGIALLWQSETVVDGWSNPKVLGSLGLWLVFAILLYLRYGVRARGRQVALLTVLAFALLLFALVSAHPFAQGGQP